MYLYNKYVSKKVLRVKKKKSRVENIIFIQVII